MPELKPCPHCGGKAQLVSFKNGYRVICESDGCVNSAKTVLFFVGTQEIAAWNKRVKDKE